MRQLLSLISVFTIVIACSEAPPPPSPPASYKEALLRSRNVYTISKNMDGYNSISLQFYQQYEGQLIELNFSSSKMNSSYYTVVNADPSSRINLQKTPPAIRLGLLKIELDGVDITSCAVAECNSGSCTGSEEPITNFNGDVSTNSFFLNLSKMANSTSRACSGMDLSQADKVHTLTFKEMGNSGSMLKGAHLNAQVIVYNRSNIPSDINQILNP